MLAHLCGLVEKLEPRLRVPVGADRQQVWVPLQLCVGGFAAATAEWIQYTEGHFG